MILFFKRQSDQNRQTESGSYENSAGFCSVTHFYMKEGAPGWQDPALAQALSMRHHMAGLLIYTSSSEHWNKRKWSQLPLLVIRQKYLVNKPCLSSFIPDWDLFKNDDVSIYTKERASILSRIAYHSLPFPSFKLRSSCEDSQLFWSSFENNFTQLLVNFFSAQSMYYAGDDSKSKYVLYWELLSTTTPAKFSSLFTKLTEL